MEGEDVDKDKYASFVRWQATTIAQLTYAIDVMLGLSVASLGFSMALIVSADYQPAPCGAGFLILAIGSLGAAIALGIACTINRLLDFRTTEEVALHARRGIAEKDLKPLRDRYRRRGKRTWQLFWWQIGTFASGVLFLTIAVVGDWLS